MGQFPASFDKQGNETLPLPLGLDLKASLAALRLLCAGVCVLVVNNRAGLQRSSCFWRVWLLKETLPAPSLGTFSLVPTDTGGSGSSQSARFHTGHIGEGEVRYTCPPRRLPVARSGTASASGLLFCVSSFISQTK